MADEVGLKLIGAWDEFRKALDPDAFKLRLDRYVGSANVRIGVQFQAKARRAIDARDYAPNSPITIILKRGQSTPLVGRGKGGGGDLYQGITYATPDPYRLRLGVVRAKAGDEVVNIAAILHQGATIDLVKHPKVRVKVWAMVREASGRRVGNKAQKASRAAAMTAIALGSSGGPKDIWIIPPRPFIWAILSDPKFGTFVRGEWTDAAKLAIFGGNKGHKGPHNKKG